MDHIERAKKLRELALRGVGGEKDNAQILLDKLVRKYGISLGELDEDVVMEFDINFHGKHEEKLLRQITYKVTGERNRFSNLTYVRSGRACRTTARVECTEAQKVEIEFLHRFYCDLWMSEVEILMKAFVQKHRLFGELKEGEEGTRLDDEVFHRVAMMMNGLSEKSPLIGIEEGA